MYKKLTAAAIGLTLMASACSSDDADWSGGDDRYATTTYAASGRSAETTTTSAEAYPDVEYDNPGVNPPTDTREDVLSTFALDVDTGSYTVARRYVSDGNLPDPDSVRVEEYVNYFDYGYREPRGDVFAIHVDGAPTPYVERQDNVVVRIGIQAQDVSDRDRRDAALTFVVDTSGSMDQENRLNGVRYALTRLVEQLNPSDSVAIVEYGSRARVVLEPTSVRDDDLIIDRINSLSPNGSTNAAEGLELGYRLARDAYREGGINRVILASDGVANVGITNADGILGTIREDADDGIQLVTVGFGMGNYSDTFMEQLADNGDGFYAYVDTLDEAERLFVDDLTGTLQTVAMDARVQVEFDASAVHEWRLVGYENRDIDDRDFRSDSVDAGEIGAGHSVTALYELTLAEDPARYRADDVLGKVSLRWHDVDGDTTSEISEPFTMGDVAERFRDADGGFQLAVMVAEYAEILRGGGRAYFSDSTLDDLADDVWWLEEYSGDPDVNEFIELVERAARLRRG